MYKIAKQFDFCYGHRVWSQQLNEEYSLDSCAKCRHLHGHQGEIIISFEGEGLTNGMLTDFKHLNWFKKWLDDTLDHKFIIDMNDPIFDILFPKILDKKNSIISEHNFKKYYNLVDSGFGALVPNNLFELNEKCTPEEMEIYEGLVVVNFVPTSENLSKWLFDIVTEKMKPLLEPLGIKVSNLQFFETPKSQSNYFA